MATELRPWELSKMEEAYSAYRGEWSNRDDPAKMDRDAFFVGWVLCLRGHHVAGVFKK